MSRIDPEDLSARARRALLSEPELGELSDALERDPVLRAAHEVGLDLDRSTAVRAGDDGVVARAADEALTRIEKSGLSAADVPRPSGFRAVTSPKRKRTLAVLLAAALVFVTGAAAAIWAGALPATWLGRARHQELTLPEQHMTKLAESSPAHATADDDKSAETTEPSADDAHVAPPRVPSRVEDAASLFRAANAARREGAFERAKRLYSELIARYPSSDEARLSRVSLGRLLLAKGDPSDAEREFDKYLKDGKGELAEEALASRAESLQKLGKTDAERRTWQRLLAEHPNSVYAAQAKQRLEALRAGGAAPAP
jgi:TolA-binding protein